MNERSHSCVRKCSKQGTYVCKRTAVHESAAFPSGVVIFATSEVTRRRLLWFSSRLLQLQSSRQMFPGPRSAPSYQPHTTQCTTNAPSLSSTTRPYILLPAPDLPLSSMNNPLLLIHAHSRSTRSTASFENPTYIRLVRNTSKGFTSDLMGHPTTKEARAAGLWMRNSLCKYTVDNSSFFFQASRSQYC
jgi:hypothetical protein